MINDPEKRRKYDQYGEHWKEAEAFGRGAGRGGAGGGFYDGEDVPFSGFDFSGFGSGTGGFSSFFQNLFGGGGGMGGGRGSRMRQNSGEMQATVNINPCRFAFACDNRNLTVTAGSPNHSSKGSEETLLFQSFHRFSS